MNSKVFVSCAVTGSGDTASKHPDLPKTPDQIAKAAIDAAARKSARNTKKNQKKKQKQKQKKAAAARIRLMDMITTRIKILEAQKSQPLENIPLSAEFAMLDFKKLVMV